MPSLTIGSNVAWRAAASAASRNTRIPLSACAETTFPFSSTMTRTVILPVAFILFISSVTTGFGNEVAFEFNTPTSIGFATPVDVLSLRFHQSP